MANLRTPVIVGITEVGEVTGETDPYDGLGTDVSWGRTEQNGASLAISGEDHDVQSGQSRLLEYSFPVSRAMEFTFRLQHVGLLNFVDALGLPSSALSGDLNGATPTDEVVAVDGELLATEEKTLYIIVPGPVSTRRYQMERMVQAGGMTIEMASNNHQVYETSWRIIAAGAGIDDMQITDSAA